jgi:hypothetical protein
LDFSSADDIGSLPLRERAAHYRKMALEALSRASVAEEVWQREQFFNLAKGWHTLAVQIEENLAASAQLESEKVTPLKRARARWWR